MISQILVFVPKKITHGDPEKPIHAKKYVGYRPPGQTIAVNFSRVVISKE